MAKRGKIQSLIVVILSRATTPQCFYTIKNKLVKQYGVSFDDHKLVRALDFLVKAKIVDLVWIDDFVDGIYIGRTGHYIL